MHARGSRSIERCRAANEKTSMDRTAIEQLSRRQKHSQWIEKLSRSYRDCDKDQLKISIDKLGVEKLLRLLKNSFSRREKHRYKCNQACNSTKDPINIIDSQKHLSTIIFKHMDPKNTHMYQEQQRILCVVCEKHCNIA